MAEKWERLTEIRGRQGEKDGEHMCKEHSMGLVKRIKWMGIKYKI